MIRFYSNIFKMIFLKHVQIFIRDNSILIL